MKFANYFEKQRLSWGKWYYDVDDLQLCHSWEGIKNPELGEPDYTIDLSQGFWLEEALPYLRDLGAADRADFFLALSELIRSGEKNVCPSL